MAEQGYFYHVSYMYSTGEGRVTYADASVTMSRRIASDDALAAVRSRLASEADEVEPAAVGPIVLTGITLLARVELPEATG